jgi:hypothetical protein
MYLKFALRDLGLALGALLLWALVARRSAVPDAIGDFSGVLAGVLLGATALLTHEWGHFLGALAGRGPVRPGASLRSPFVFRFDSRRSSQAQFLVMSVGGWLGTVAAVWAAAALLPGGELASRVARGTTLISAVLAFAIEVPLVARALWTGRLPDLDRRPAKPSEGLA